MEYSKVAIAATVVALGLLSMLEAFVAKRRGIPAYDGHETLASIALFVGHKLADAAALGLTLLVANWAWDHRLLTMPTNVWTLGLMFLGVEFFYYWHHRLSHEINWLWATHSVHHTAERFNLTVSFRLGWMPLIDGVAVFFIPLTLLGFNPHLLLAMFVANKVYQFWIHSAIIPRLGWFERFFNSPANHRVHHAKNAEYLDKNYGGSLIIFDRMFGSFVPESPNIAIEYGLVHPLKTKNFLRIALNGWVQMYRALLVHHASPQDLLTVALGKPGAIGLEPRQVPLKVSPSRA